MVWFRRDRKRARAAPTQGPDGSRFCDAGMLFWGALLLGLALRLSLLVHTPTDGAPGGDLLVYYRTAILLTQSSGAWLRESGEFGYRAPLYSIYLFLAYELGGSLDYRIGQLANILLYAGVMVSLRMLLRREFGPRVSLIGVSIRALAPPFVISDLLLQTEVLFEIFALTSTALALEAARGQSGVRQAFLLGASMAAGALTREYAQGLVLLTCGLLAYLTWRGRRLRSTWWAALMAGLLLILAPWFVRNTIVWGSPLPLATTSGVNLHIGNHPDATGTWTHIGHPDHVTPPNLSFGSRQADRWHRERALQYIATHPERFIQLASWKLSYLLWPQTMKQEIMDDPLWPTLPAALRTAMVLANAATIAFLWLVGVLGLCGGSSALFGRAVLVWAAYTGLVTVLAFGAPRFADPIMHLLLGPAAAVLSHPRRTIAAGLQDPARRLITSSSWLLLATWWALLLFHKLG